MSAIPGFVAGLDAFRTERLHATRLRPDDIGDLLRMDQDPQVMASLGGMRSEAATREYLRKNLEHWDRFGCGIWILRGSDDGAFMGRCALRSAKVEEADDTEIGYALLAEHWGRGYATEASRALLEIAWTKIGLSDVVAFVSARNVASRRVVEKIGGRYERDVLHAGLPHQLFRVERPA